MTEDPLWSKLCVKIENKDPKDGHGCNEGSYRNLTEPALPYMKLLHSLTDQQIQEKINENADKIMSDNNYRKLLSRTFSKNNPYSQYMAAIFETTDNVYESTFKKDFFLYKEQETKKIEG